MTGKQYDEKLKERGKAGEKYICTYLAKNGYNIICTNYSSRYGEIDVIAENESVIAFVEVKTRKPNSLASGLESITSSKLKKFIKTAADYLAKHNTDKQPRIDCVQVIMSDDNSVVDLKYIENAVDDWSGYLKF